jgi:hypothetical protein
LQPTNKVQTIKANHPLKILEDSNLGKINEVYRPWGGRRVPKAGMAPDYPENYDLRIQDPMVRWSDDWNFPTNKLPNIGWLGRIHRGTPWQSIYLKATAASSNDWYFWGGSLGKHPTNDWKLLELFTAAPNENAARGALSVNQEGFAAWSALLSGVIALSNTLTTVNERTLPESGFAPAILQPTSIQLSNIYNNIMAYRKSQPGGVFSSAGQILGATNLTVTSPFLRLTTEQTRYAINDAAYERLPEQIMGLVKVGQPRFAVYSFGQALKPAPNSIVVNPPGNRPDLFNVCTNYQITGETVTRTVLRVEGTPQNPKVIIESYNILPGEEE